MHNDGSILYTGLPKVTVNPSSQYVVVTRPTKFATTVSGVGKENFNYQWKHNGEDINGESSNALIIDSVTDDRVGIYECVVKNEFGNLERSNACKLYVTAATGMYLIMNHHLSAGLFVDSYIFLFLYIICTIEIL